MTKILCQVGMIVALLWPFSELLTLPAEACGEISKGRQGTGYLLPSGNGNDPFAASLLYVQEGRDFRPAMHSLPYGTEVNIDRKIMQPDGTSRFAEVRVVSTGQEVIVPISAVANFRFWECSPEVLFRGLTSLAPKSLPLLPMALAGLVTVGTEHGRDNPLDVSAQTAGREIVCHPASYAHGYPPSPFAECFGIHASFDIVSSALRIVTPDELNERMPTYSLMHKGCDYRRVDGFRVKSAVGEIGYLLPQLPWSSSRSGPVFEMTPVFKRTGPIMFEQTGFLPYGTKVTIDDETVGFTSKGMYRIHENVEGEEYYVKPIDVQFYEFWKCDLRYMIEDHNEHRAPRTIAQLPVRIIKTFASAVGYNDGKYIEPERLENLMFAWCDTYSPIPDMNGQGQRSTRCQARGLSFTIDVSALQVIDPKDPVLVRR